MELNYCHDSSLYVAQTRRMAIKGQIPDDKRWGFPDETGMQSKRYFLHSAAVIFYCDD